MFGIPNCDTVKKARVHLEKSKISFEFIDFKKQPPTKEFLQGIQAQLGDLPTNPKGPTFRKIKAEFEQATPTQKLKLLIENSSAIKRPILLKNNKLIAIGYDESEYKKLK
jgi:Spx/MgsR family transcriptional regulator